MSQENNQPPTRRRVKVIYLILFPLLAVVASASFWLQSNFATNQVPDSLTEGKPAHPSSRIGLYSIFLMADDHILDDQLKEVLARLANECHDVSSEVVRVDKALHEQNPQLDSAFKAPVGTFFVGGQSPSTSEFYSQCQPILDDMVDEFLQSQSESSKKAREIEPALRRVLLATVAQAKVEPEDLEALRQSFVAGMTEPLVLSCLIRTSDVSYQKRSEVSKVLFLNRKKRPMSAPTIAFVYASIAQIHWMLSVEEHSVAIAEGIQEFALAWQWAVKGQVMAPYKAFLFAETHEYSSLINGFAVADLLIELDRRTTPEVPPEVKHLIAYQIGEIVAGEYRGGDFISYVPGKDMQKFKALSSTTIMHLAKAWTIAPEYDILASLLMALEMRTGDTGHSVDFWFWHSIVVISDSKLAFKYYERFIKTRHGNSGGNPLMFAEALVSSDLTKSNAFFSFAAGLNKFASEQCFRADLGKDPRLLRIAKLAVKQLRDHSKDQKHELVKSETISTVIGLLWQAGEFEDLDWLLSIYCSVVRCDSLHVYRVHTDEVQRFSHKVIESESEAWRQIHSLLHSDTRKLSVAQLDTLERAIAKAEIDANSDTALLSLLQIYHRRSQLARRLLAGEKIVFSEEDLSDWFKHDPFENFLTIDSTTLGSQSEITNQFGTNPTNAGASLAVPDDSAASPMENLATEVGCVDIESYYAEHDARLVFPLLLDPPFCFSADMELINGSKSQKDWHGVSLLIGPSLTDAHAIDSRGPMLTVLPNLGGFIRDFLPHPTWKEGSRDLAKIKSSESLVKCNIKVEAYSDGFRSYLNDKSWEEIETPIVNSGWIQVGRYADPYTYGPHEVPMGEVLPTSTVTYRISNIRLQVLPQKSIHDVKSQPADVSR